MVDINLQLHEENLLQRQKWYFTSLLLIVIVLVQSVFIYFLASKVDEKKETIKYVEFSQRGDFAFKVVEEGGIDLDQRKLLIEQQLQQYVINRVSNVISKKSGNNEIDASKIKFVTAFSSKEVNQQYEAEVFRIYNNSDFMKREVSVMSSSEVEPRRYRFDFLTIDTLSTGETLEQRWVVYIKYDILSPNDLNIFEHKIINPLGIKITYYRGDIDLQPKINIKDANQF